MDKQKIIVLDEFLDKALSCSYIVVEMMYIKRDESGNPYIYDTYFIANENPDFSFTTDISEATKFNTIGEAKKFFLQYYKDHKKGVKVGLEPVKETEKICNMEFNIIIRSVLEIYNERSKYTVYSKFTGDRTAKFYNIIYKKGE